MRCFYYYDSYRCLVLVNRQLTKSSFCKRAGALSGYAEDLFSRIYDSIFSEADDVYENFEEYYSVEYDSFEDYLRMKYSLSTAAMKSLMSDFSASEKRIYDVDVLSYGDSAVYEFWSADNMIERIASLLI